MPTIVITVPSDCLTAMERRALAVEMTDLVTAIMRKRREVTSARVDEGDPTGWVIGGRPVAMAAHAEITVTQGTNTVEEKAEMLRRSYAALVAALPGLSEASYVVVREIVADAWGYGGLTQAARLPSQK